MKSKEIRPYEFFFLDEDIFQELIINLKDKGGDYKISTIGLIREYDSLNNEFLLVLDNFSVKINTSRIANSFKCNPNSYYYIYGVLKVRKIN